MSVSPSDPNGPEYEYSHSSLRSSLHHHPYHETYKGHSFTTDLDNTLMSNVSNFPLTFRLLPLSDTGSLWINPGLSSGQSVYSDLTFPWKKLGPSASAESITTPWFLDIPVGLQFVWKAKNRSRRGRKKSGSGAWGLFSLLLYLPASNLSLSPPTPIHFFCPFSMNFLDGIQDSKSEAEKVKNGKNR